MFIASKNIKSILCVFTLLVIPMNNILAMELACVGKIDKRETNVIEDVEFTAKFSTESGSYTDGVLVSVDLPVNSGEDSIKFTQDMAWDYHVSSEYVGFYHRANERKNQYSFRLDHINGNFFYEEYNKNYGYRLYAKGEGTCTSISD